MTNNLIKFPSARKIYEVLEDVESNMDNITEAVVVYRVKDRKENKYTIKRYWFGENSSINCLGLASHMVDLIADYIYNEGDDEDLN
ncbi:MAG: hypothetical protein DRP09_15500 [Candidatus Thorarchaeota archaeon]|nr:MAG: hypothetical protein DRP09_15500 [Candidatus Thorarchaeota archaeon]